MAAGKLVEGKDLGYINTVDLGCGNGRLRVISSAASLRVAWKRPFLSRVLVNTPNPHPGAGCPACEASAVLAIRQKLENTVSGARIPDSSRTPTKVLIPQVNLQNVNVTSRIMPTTM